MDQRHDFPGYLACQSCDSMFDVSRLRDGDTASCSRCGGFLTRYVADQFVQVVAIAIAALVLLALGCSYPFMTLNLNGLESGMTLPQVALSLIAHRMPLLSISVAAFIIVIPAVVLILVIALAGAIALERHFDWLRPVGRLIFTLQSWSMVEVFFLGVLVSLVKISGIAMVEMGFAFWAYAVFSFLFLLAVTGLDRAQCWHQIEQLSQHE
ncbi:MAG: paraquat-inducible protein A [Immundisolibacteraceae bacterium]|nr:paraquat-inducible protein A [Immundisolibacteraceae bacterium]